MSRPNKYVSFPTEKCVDYTLTFKSKITLLGEPLQPTLHPISCFLQIINYIINYITQQNRKAYKNISNYSRQLQNSFGPSAVSKIQIFRYFHRFLWIKLQKAITPQSSNAQCYTWLSTGMFWISTINEAPETTVSLCQRRYTTKCFTLFCNSVIKKNPHLSVYKVKEYFIVQMTI